MSAGRAVARGNLEAGSQPAPMKHVLRAMTEPGREFYRRLAEGRPCATRCEACDLTLFPPLARCPDCGGPASWIELPVEGRLHAFTTQERALRFRAPVVLALVELGGAVLPAVCETPYEELEIGMAVGVEARPVEEVGLSLLFATPARARSRPGAEGTDQV